MKGRKRRYQRIHSGEKRDDKATCSVDFQSLIFRIHFDTLELILEHFNSSNPRYFADEYTLNIEHFILNIIENENGHSLVNFLFQNDLYICVHRDPFCVILDIVLKEVVFSLFTYKFT